MEAIIPRHLLQEQARHVRPQDLAALNDGSVLVAIYKGPYKTTFNYSDFVWFKVKPNTRLTKVFESFKAREGDSAITALTRGDIAVEKDDRVQVRSHFR